MLSRRLSILAAFLLLPLTSSAQPEPGAFELLARTRQAYAELPAYQDHGEIETTLADTGVTIRHRFELSAGAETFRFLLERDLAGEPRRRVIWRRGGEAFHSDSALGQYKPVASLADEVAGALGNGGADALVVPLTLAGRAGALADPEVATVEGREPCGDGTCWIVFLSRESAVESRLWIDSRTSLIRQVEVRLHDAGDVIDQAMAQAGMAIRGGSARGSITLRVRHEIEAADRPLQTAEATFGPPPGARRVTEWQVSGEREMPEFGEEITVALATVTVRVVDNYGKPVQGLAPGDFRVLARGNEIPVVAVDWVSAVRPEAPAPPDGAAASAIVPETAAALATEPPGKRVVFFVQPGDVPTRLRGQMRLRPHTRELLGSFPAADRFAVVSYDSHLKLWQDFTGDRDAVHRAIDQAMLFGGDRQTVVRPGRDRSSLAAHFDFDAALRTASPERALQVTAEALQPLPGEKVMIYLGWGLGRYSHDGARMTPEYRPAIEALDAARVTVFVLDITDADYHTLETGLQSVAYQTGGTYAKTHIFPKHATDFLAGTVSGHYVLTLDRTALPPQGARVRISLRDKKGTVYYARPDPVPGVARK